MMFFNAFKTFVLAALFVVASSHEGHDEDQMPLNYIKYPYQASYHKKDTGN